MSSVVVQSSAVVDNVVAGMAIDGGLDTVRVSVMMVTVVSSQVVVSVAVTVCVVISVMLVVRVAISSQVVVSRAVEIAVVT